MKKLLLLIFIATLQLSAQPYSHFQTVTVYNDLVGDTLLTTSAPWSYASSFTVPIGFQCNFMGNNYSSVNVEGSGFAYFDVNYYYLALPFGVKLKSKGGAVNNSPISYKTEGIAPNRICKIQWKNAGFHYDTSSTINFQLWLYEAAGYIQFWYGPSSVPNPSVVYQENGSAGPVIGIYEYTSPSNCSYSHCLSGPPGSPTSVYLTGNINLFATSVNSTPPAHSVHTFDPGFVGIPVLTNSSFSVYPNPSDEFLLFTSDAPVENCVLFSIDGGTRIKRQPDGQQLFVGDLPSGVYILEAQIEGVVSRQKLVISH